MTEPTGLYCCGLVFAAVVTVGIVLILARIAKGGGPPDPGW